MLADLRLKNPFTVPGNLVHNLHNYVDAFMLNWSEFNNIYVSPAFSVIGCCLQKIREEASGIVIAPLWPTQPWFTRLMELHTHSSYHPQEKEIVKIAKKILGPFTTKQFKTRYMQNITSMKEAFLYNLQIFSHYLGETIIK